jgi:predicted glycogen debranching enzyme
VESILDGYSAGTRFGIHADADGLLYAGVDGSSVTWMDARVNGHAITPRIGKPAEVQALWINALQAGSRFSGRWAATRKAALASFGERFWNESRGCLYDVVDVDHAAGTVDPAIRPNQVFAVGGLPLALLKGPKASSIVDVIEEQLLTPAGLRSLSPSEPGYCPRYEGGPSERDGAYHQGTVWPWLMGAFVDAWLRIRRNSKAARKEARARFLEPLLDRLDLAGIGHVSEIADAESPHPPRGCPFQAWSVGETIRIERMLRE